MSNRPPMRGRIQEAAVDLDYGRSGKFGPALLRPASQHRCRIRAALLLPSRVPSSRSVGRHEPGEPILGLSRHNGPIWRFRHSRNSLKSCCSFRTSERVVLVFFEASSEPGRLAAFVARTGTTLGVAEVLGCSRRTFGGTSSRRTFRVTNSRGSTCSSVTRPENRSHSSNARISAGRVEQLTVVRRIIGMRTVARKLKEQRSLLPHRPRRSRSMPFPIFGGANVFHLGGFSQSWNYPNLKLRQSNRKTTLAGRQLGF
jgi:hypothetical protein